MDLPSRVMEQAQHAPTFSNGALLDKAIASGAIASPWWLPHLAEISTGAGAVCALGGILLLVQRFYLNRLERKKLLREIERLG